jgi:acetoin utilization deacetylase AcuC-like enzyme
MNAIPVFYSDDMLAESDCRSPGASKPKPVVEAWELAGLPIERRPVIPATVEELCLAHDPDYVQLVLLGVLENGFRNTRPDVARSLPYTNGAMIGAASAALDTGIACAPSCGFHHAEYARARKFCTFNGLMIAAIKLLRAKRVSRVLILDLDIHWADGTDDIIERLGLACEIENASFGKYFCTEAQADAYLADLRRLATRFSDFDLIIYHAGVDVHVDDPLGGVLTTEQLRERDRFAFEGASRAGVPLAWTLGGGYQEPVSKVIQLHTITMQECARAYLPLESSHASASQASCRDHSG